MGDREGDDGEGGNMVGRPVASGGSGGSCDPNQNGQILRDRKIIHA